MSMFKKKDEAPEVKEDELIIELCNHLQQMGINATVLEAKSSEDIGALVNFALGSVKIEGRNLDLIQVERIRVAAENPKLQPGQQGYTREIGQGSTRYNYHYVVRANVTGLENKLKAEIKPIEKRKGLFGKEVVGFQWEGGELAQQLNSDSDLKNMLLKSGLHTLLIKPETVHQCVRITPATGPETRTPFDFSHHPTILGRKMFPTRETFEIYDKIAQHIHRLANAQP